MDPMPCPFCGNADPINVVAGDTHRWRVAECGDCGARASEVRWIYTDSDPDAAARERAIKEWNIRA